jgi:hypothetical protein
MGSARNQGMAENLGEVGILAEVGRFKLVRADFGVGTGKWPGFRVRPKAAFKRRRRTGPRRCY